MVLVVLVEKSGSLTDTKLKAFSVEEICKKAKIKNLEDCARKHVWSVYLQGKVHHIALYARSRGRAGQENKYDFPPPVDNDLYFGNCMLVSQRTASDANDVLDLTSRQWETIYEQLLGGFDSCVEDDYESIDDTRGLHIGKDGYEIDDFVVDDDEEEETNCEYTDEEEEEYEEKLKKKKAPKKTSGKPKKEPRHTTYEVGVSVVIDDGGCDSELEEEGYFT
jgi:hypothetical protein